MKLTLHVWRQPGPDRPGRFVRYEAADISEHASFLEMLDILNERLAERGEDPIAFEHDCREGICGACGLVVNGAPHGPNRAGTTCQLHMRTFRDGDEIWVDLYEDPKIVQAVQAELKEKTMGVVYKPFVPDGPPPLPKN